MATHSSVLAWRIPGTGQSGGLPSMGSYRVGHDWSDLAAAAAATDSVCFCRKNLFITKIFHYWGLLLTRNWCLICFPSNKTLASFKKKIKEWKQDRKKKIEKSQGCYCIYQDPHITRLTLMNLALFWTRTGVKISVKCVLMVKKKEKKKGYHLVYIKSS